MLGSHHEKVELHANYDAPTEEQEARCKLDKGTSLQSPDLIIPILEANANNKYKTSLGGSGRSLEVLKDTQSKKCNSNKQGIEIVESTFNPYYD